MEISHEVGVMIITVPASIVLVLLIINRIRVHFNNFVNDGEWFMSEHDDLENIYNVFNSRDTFTGTFFTIVIPFGVFLMGIAVLLLLRFPIVMGCVLGGGVIVALFMCALVYFGKRERNKKLFEDKLRGK